MCSRRRLNEDYLGRRYRREGAEIQARHQIAQRLSWVRRAREVKRVSLTISYVSRNPGPDPLKYGMPADYHLGLTFWPDTPDLRN
jgi:hypothetical protein